MLAWFKDGAVVDVYQRRSAGTACARLADVPIPNIDLHTGGVIKLDEFIVCSQWPDCAEFADDDVVRRLGSGRW